MDVAWSTVRQPVRPLPIDQPFLFQAEEGDQSFGALVAGVLKRVGEV